MGSKRKSVRWMGTDVEDGTEGGAALQGLRMIRDLEELETRDRADGHRRTHPLLLDGLDVQTKRRLNRVMVTITVAQETMDLWDEICHQQRIKRGRLLDEMFGKLKRNWEVTGRDKEERTPAPVKARAGSRSRS